MSLILIADDQESIREGFNRILTLEGYQTLQAKNGLEALTMIKQSKIDLIISDGRMPQMSGFELLQIVRATPLIAYLPFILITAESAAEVIHRVGSNLQYTYLNKPVRQAELLKAILDLLTVHH